MGCKRNQQITILMTEKETRLAQLYSRKNRLYELYRRVQDEINALQQEIYDDLRCYRTGERQLDTRIDGHRVREGVAPKYQTLLFFTPQLYL